ncbi:MAG: hypothetical protein EPN33_06490 [Acidobacteria bacterium]|nr:MAG: hypothetical protein EPN33_06490 [Acidobacteriota bacterium]
MRRRSRNIGLGCIFMAAIGIAGAPGLRAQAQGQTTQAPAEPAVSTLDANLVVPAAPDTYVVGDDDVLTVLVDQMRDLTGQYRVDARGDISLPYLGQPIHAAGATPPQIAQRIVTDLARAHLAHQPQVRVVVREVASHMVVVSGAVNHPGVLEAIRPLTLAEAIARAGGLSQEAGDQVRIRTLPEGGGRPQVTELPLEPIVEGLQSGPLLTGQESVQVEPATFVYVVGAVTKSGAFPITAGQRMTLLRALALAQGLSGTADKQHVQIMYQSASATPPPDLVVNLDGILKRRAEDIALHSGAVVYVAESQRSKVLAAVINTSMQTLALAVGYNAGRIF